MLERCMDLRYDIVYKVLSINFSLSSLPEKILKYVKYSALKSNTAECVN